MKHSIIHHVTMGTIVVVRVPWDYTMTAVLHTESSTAEWSEGGLWRIAKTNKQENHARAIV